MTFKHINFGDSSVMRSLERVAVKKGLVKEDLAKSMHKTASKQPDLEVSDDFTTNLLKLCAGLRSCDLEKYAEEIEKNYLNFKQAQTLYQAHKETGEDLINSAHPQGSHKLENVDSDEAVIETVLDQHLKILKTINKKPTGKLSSANEIINAVKIVLGQSEQELDTMRKKKAGKEVEQIYYNLKEASKLAQNLPFESLAQFNYNVYQIDNEINIMFKSLNNITFDKLNDIKTDLYDIIGIVKYPPADDPDEKQIYINIRNEIESAIISIENAINYVNKNFDKYLMEEIQGKSSKEEIEKKKQELKTKKLQQPLVNLKDMSQYNIDNLVNTAIQLNNYENLIKKSNYSTADKEYANDFIDKHRISINEVNNKFKELLSSLGIGADIAQKKDEYNKLATEASERMQEINLFKQQWIVPLGKV